MNKLKSYAFSFLAGIFMALGYPSILGKSLLITPIIGMTILFGQLFKEKSLKKKVLTLLVFNLAFNTFGFYWITDTLVEFGELPYILAGLLSSLFTFIITPYLWIALFIIHFIQNKKVEILNINGIISFSFAILMTTLEYFSPQQFDVMLGQPFVVLGKYLGFASLFGLPIYSFISYLIVFELIRVLKVKSFCKFNASVILIFIVLNPILINENKQIISRPFNFRVVQANISNYLKMDSEKGAYASVSQVINRYKDLSLAESELELDLIIWPETAYPYLIETDHSNLSASTLPLIFGEIANIKNSNLLIGGYDRNINSNSQSTYKTEYNSAFKLNRQGIIDKIYHKHILIPFGETLPFGPLNKYLSRYIKNISFFSEGEDYPLFRLDSGHSFITTICYELLKPEFIRTYLNSIESKPEVLINLTNDSWYGDTMEPEQHLFLAKWRALEFNIPIIRATNTGISSLILPDGSEPIRLGILKTGNLDYSFSTFKSAPTLFQKFGFATILPLWIIGLIIHLLLIKLKNEK